MKHLQVLKCKQLRLVFFLMAFCIAATASGQEDHKVYDCIAVAKMDNTIFRGELAEKYTYTIKGTAYAYSDEFGKGNIIFNGKLYLGVFMNLNSHRDELQLKASESGISATTTSTAAAADDGINIALKKNLVGDFSIGERNFTTLCGENAVKGLKEGYYEVLYKRGNNMLVKRHYKNVSEKTDAISGKMETIFKSKHKYYLVADGSVKTIQSEKNLIKICRDKKSDAKEYLRKNKGKDSEELMKGVMLIIEK